MEIETIVVGAFACNCRVLTDPKTQEAVIIDPGDEAEAILRYVEGKGLKVKGLVHTHAHLDHVMATRDIKQRTLAPIYLHQKDLPLYQNLKQQAALFGFETEDPAPVDHFLEHEMEIKWGQQKLKTIHTPGHSPGSCCFYWQGKDSLLFTGDTLFLKSVGRTDLWGGNSEQLMKSIKNRIYALDGDTQVLPGHGPDSTVEFEKRNNPFT